MPQPGAAPATNRLVVDLHELVLAAWVPVPRTGVLRLRHRFPHARSVAWSTYHPLTLSPIEALRDREIVPDDGVANPFIAGADRTASHREYTVVVSRRSPQEVGEPNVLSSHGLPLVILFYRVYVPDRGRDRLGDAGVPVVEGDPARWTSRRRRIATTVATTLTWNVTAAGLTPPYLALRAVGRTRTGPAVTDGRWDAFFNVPRLAAPLLRDTWAAGLVEALPRAPRGPAANWATDSAIASIDVDRRLGPAPDGRNVLVVQGSMPRTPRTWHGDAIMDDRAELRYWSLSSMTAVPIGVTTRTLFDEQVPVDEAGRYTIVVSTPADRPVNATWDRGVAWLPWSARGDGYGRRAAGVLALRNQDPAPDFRHAIQHVSGPGAEASVMGEYLPTQRYLSREQFEEEEGPG
ncbi:hypothetical protein LRS13_10610 [Svornostia abyssi]|uniref:Uncharacterized protein n=1 Tax=Svornostia abyssi TaxID=2898438 RepID=A0ABY5PMK6_9ACTN|nr:hypothetical protein LRS13_10610 [Parviterribacteraceae bacterium J379]